MHIFLRATAAVLVAVIMFIVIGKNNKEIALLLTVCVCCMVGAAIGVFLEPVVEFAGQLREVGNLDSDQFEILLKVVGIGFLAEVTALICSDAGNAALGKILQLLSGCVILWLSVPLLSSLLTLIQRILGEL